MRIRQCAELAGSGDALAQKAAIPRRTLETYLTGAEPKTFRLVSIARAVGVSLQWLATGDGEMRGEGASHRIEEPRAGYVYLPLYEVNASAGNGALIEQEHISDLLAFKEAWLRQELNAGARDVVLLFVSGRSMEPDLRPGDVIMVDVRDTTAQREAIYVIRMDGAILVKELQRLPGGVIRVRSKNPEYDAFEKNIADLGQSQDFSIIGRVVWSGRRF